MMRMANKRSAKVYSPGEMEALRKNPNVYEVQEHRLLLTLEFRQQIYEEWVREPKRATVRRMLERNGLVEARLNAAADKARKVRAATAKRRQAAQQICKTPEMVVARDQRILLRKISKWMRSKTTAIQQISHLTAVLKKAQRAGVFLMSAPAELITELTDGRNWSAHPELSYIYEMRELF